MEVTASTSATSSATSSVDGRGGGGGDYVNLGMFGGQTGVGDLLLGAGGFGGSLGNGFGNDSGAANSSNVGGSAFDINEFPTLGGNSPVVQGQGQGGSGGNGLQAALRQQHQLLAQQQAQQQMLQNNTASKQTNLYRLAMSANGTQTNFNIEAEDFPLLSPQQTQNNTGNTGAAPTTSSILLSGHNSSANPSIGGQAFSGNASVSRPTNNPRVGGLYELPSGGSQLDSPGLLGGAGIAGLGGLQQQPGSSASSSLNLPSRTPPSTAPATAGLASSSNSGVGSGSAAGTALSGDYGLLGLLGVIRMTDADRNSLALGSDLTMLGLSLGSSDQIYQTFASPWSETVSTKEPHYQLPMCYCMQPPALKTGHLSKFQLETLFYIFYALPKDVLQAYAAQELYTREWRYHADLKLWFKRVGPADGVATGSGSASQYLFFDITSWERRGFNGSMTQNFTSGFLSEEDIRVKFASS